MTILLLIRCRKNSAFSPFSASARVVPTTQRCRQPIRKLTHSRTSNSINSIFMMSHDPFILPFTTSSILETIFTSSHTVPLGLSFAINSSLFLALRSKLNKVLTPEGYMHALALGTMLWYCLGWKGWSVCVLYLLLGSLVTKVKFAEKQARGIAEGRGGRRGPENVWFVYYTSNTFPRSCFKLVTHDQILLAFCHFF